MNLSAGIAEAYAQLGYAWRLHDVASEQIRPRRAHYRADIDAVVMFEITIFNRLQSAQQQRRNLSELDEAAILLQRAIQGRDTRRIEPHAGQCSA